MDINLVLYKQLIFSVKFQLFAFYWREEYNMIFTRKIQKNTMHSYGLITIPKPIMGVWSDIEKLDMLFDEAHGTIVITPRR